MRPPDDAELLTEYVTRQSENAFTELVGRNVALVYSAALRQVREPQLAEEVTQAVFIILARKARAMSRHAHLSGWLCRVAYFVSRDALRAERRRQHRERILTPMENPADNDWTRIAPLLDEVVAQLNEKDRSAIVLRFYEQKSLGEVGAALGVDTDAAQKRVARALEKLRAFFIKRGIDSTAASLAGAISANSIQAVPAALAKTISGVALAKGAAASTSTLTLIKGALKIMAWTKAKTAIVGSAVVLLAAGTTTITVKIIQEHRTYPWQIHEGYIDFNQVKQPPQVRILHSTFHKSGEYSGDILLGTGASAQDVIAVAYGFVTPARAILPAGLPVDRYDYIACLSGGIEANRKALQEKVKNKFGVVAKTETRDADVWLLKVKSPNAPALKRHQGPNNGNGASSIPGGLRCWNDGMGWLVGCFESWGNKPVIDGTGLNGNFDFDLHCSEADLANRDLDAVNQALDPLGLEVVPTNMPIEMLVVEKVKN